MNRLNSNPNVNMNNNNMNNNMNFNNNNNNNIKHTSSMPINNPSFNMEYFNQKINRK